LRDHCRRRIEPAGPRRIGTCRSQLRDQVILGPADGRRPHTRDRRLPRKNEYNIEITLDGYQPQTLALARGINGWVFGNLFVGWIVGFIVDFASGSAYKLEPAVVSVWLVSAEDGMYTVVRFYTDQNRGPDPMEERWQLDANRRPQPYPCCRSRTSSWST
jgi:hypothetical protein